VTYKHAVSGGGAAQSTTPVRVAVQQRFGAYATSQSGAYIFRPTNDPESWGQSVPSATVQVSAIPLYNGSGVAGPSLRFGGLTQVVRVSGSIFSQTLRLSDTLGWYRGALDGLAAGEIAEPLCRPAPRGRPRQPPANGVRVV